MNNCTTEYKGHVLLVGDLDPPAGGLATYCRYVAEGLAGHAGWTVSFVDAWAVGKKTPPEHVQRRLGTTPRRCLAYVLHGISRLMGRNNAALRSAFRDLSWRDRVRTLALAGWLDRVMRRERPDVVHTNQAGVRTLACMLAASRYSCPVVVALHGSEFAGPRLLHLRDVGRKVCNLATAVIANSRFTARQARAGGVNGNIETIPLGVDLDRYRAGPVSSELLSRYGLSASRRRILFAGALGANKGPLVLLDAYRALPEEIKRNVECVFVGPDDGQEAELRSRARETRLVGVHILGRVPRSEFPAFYRAAEVFVFPTTIYEGFGLVALEAAASGCAIIASRIGAIPEVVAEGENGILVEPHEPGVLAAALAALLTDSAKLDRFRRASRDVAARFTWKATVDATSDLLLRAIGGCTGEGENQL